MSAAPRIGTVKEFVLDDEGEAIGTLYTGVCACKYRTSGWPLKKIAVERIKQHRNEHQTGEPMELLSEFRARHGLVSAGKNAVFPEEAKKVK